VPGLEGKAAAPPTGFVKVIQAFDSHERGILFQWSAGSPFMLSAVLRQRLANAVQVDVPGDAYVATDYTLDWRHAAITCSRDPGAWHKPQPLGHGTITGSQEDVDLLVAWEEKGPHLVLIEVEGSTGWSNKQMRSKADRLKTIVTPKVLEEMAAHFVLVGPSRSRGLQTEFWPEWIHKQGRTHFVKLADPGPRWSVQLSEPALEPPSSSTRWCSRSVSPRRWK